jgi:hypothetical protein
MPNPNTEQKCECCVTKVCAAQGKQKINQKKKNQTMPKKCQKFQTL